MFHTGTRIEFSLFTGGKIIKIIKSLYIMFLIFYPKYYNSFIYHFTASLLNSEENCQKEVSKYHGNTLF